MLNVNSRVAPSEKLPTVIFQGDEDVLLQFYKNMIKSSSLPDLRGTLTKLSVSLLLNLTSASKCEVIRSLSVIQDVLTSVVVHQSSPMSIKSTSHLKSLISTVCYPKLSSFLTFPKVSYIACLVLEAYISCLSSERFPVIRVTSSDATDVTKSHFLHGVTFSVRRVSILKSIIDKGAVRVVVFSCNLPQELDHYEGDTFTQINGLKSIEHVFVDETTKILEDHIRAQNVDVLFCQKVVHQKIKKYLRDHGVVVVDRLSVFHAENVAILANIRLLPSISEWETGHVGNVGIFKLKQQWYIHLKPVSDSHLGIIVLNCVVSF